MNSPLDEVMFTASESSSSSSSESSISLELDFGVSHKECPKCHLMRDLIYFSPREVHSKTAICIVCDPRRSAFSPVSLTVTLPLPPSPSPIHVPFPVLLTSPNSDPYPPMTVGPAAAPAPPILRRSARLAKN